MPAIFYPSTVKLILTSEFSSPSHTGDTTFHCVRQKDSSQPFNSVGRVICILPLVESDETQRRRANIIADALNKNEK